MFSSLATTSAGLGSALAAAVSLLGRPNELAFTQDAEGLRIQLPQPNPGNGPYALRITGLKLD